jgi:hypothetical protein
MTDHLQDEIQLHLRRTAHHLRLAAAGVSFGEDFQDVEVLVGGGYSALPYVLSSIIGVIDRCQDAIAEQALPHS